jgi:hypothetical protein
MVSFESLEDIQSNVTTVLTKPMEKFSAMFLDMAETMECMN